MSTAMHRKTMSAPLRWLLENTRFPGPVLDYGCGHGQDVRELQARDYVAHGWDPVHFPNGTDFADKRDAYAIVLCTYVLNTIESPDDRDAVLADIVGALAPGGTAFVTVRRDVQTDGSTSRGWQGNVLLATTDTALVRSLHRVADYEIYEVWARRDVL